jgi:hypothetical protein
MYNQTNRLMRNYYNRYLIITHCYVRSLLLSFRPFSVSFLSNGPVFYAFLVLSKFYNRMEISKLADLPFLNG